MDKDEEEREVNAEESGKVKQKDIENVEPLPVAAEYGEGIKELLADLEHSHKAIYSLMEKDSKSLFSNKRILNYIINVTNLAYWTARNNLVSYFAVDYLHRKLDMLEEAVIILARQMKDLPASEDVKKMRDMSVRMTEMDELMAKLKQMTEQEQLEKANTWEKIDKARQQLMKDIV